MSHFPITTLFTYWREMLLHCFLLIFWFFMLFHCLPCQFRKQFNETNLKKLQSSTLLNFVTFVLLLCSFPHKQSLFSQWLSLLQLPYFAFLHPSSKIKGTNMVHNSTILVFTSKLIDTSPLEKQTIVTRVLPYILNYLYNKKHNNTILW